MRSSPANSVLPAHSSPGPRGLFAVPATVVPLFATLFAALFATLFVALLHAPVAFAVDWQGITPREVVLFYPGQDSWEWLLTATDHPGASGIRGGSHCGACHEGQQSDMGKAIAARTPPPSVVGATATSGNIAINVRTAWDKERFYLRASWPVRGDGGKPSLFTVMLDDGQVTEATRAGCWGACHDDLKGMPSAANSDVRSKYLVASRGKVTRQGGGDNIKSPSELAALLAQGKFLEYWQVQVAATSPVRISDGYVLEQRHLHPQAAVSAQATQEDGRWIIELSRARGMDTPGRKVLTAGNTYTLGFALHESGAGGRFHYVSFGYSLTLTPGDADLIAKRVD